uniref:ORF S1-1 n=1 Tax=Equid alphaherpesvirus 1 TaxID=10326 RepID=Q69271_9ALPH|nr:ORF S1-1 [Equid alphaherpesvirus 1]
MRGRGLRQLCGGRCPVPTFHPRPHPPHAPPTVFFESRPHTRTIVVPCKRFRSVTFSHGYRVIHKIPKAPPSIHSGRYTSMFHFLSLHTTPRYPRYRFFLPRVYRGAPPPSMDKGGVSIKFLRDET